MKTIFIRIITLALCVCFLISCGGRATEAPPLAGGIAFTAERTSVQAGECTLLHWEVTEGFGVRLNGEPVDKVGQMKACPAETRGYELAVDPSNPDMIFVGFYGGSLAISTDGGQTWNLSASGMSPEAMVSAIVVDLINPQVVYAGTLNSGVYLSLDGGQTWSALNDGLLNRTVRGLALSTNGSVLYAVSEGGGVFRLGTPDR